MYTSRAPNKHWLDDVAEASGLRGFHLDANPSFQQVRAAWAEVACHAEVSEGELARRVASHFRLQMADLADAEPHATKLLPERIARKHGILPLRVSDQVVVAATSDPANTHAEQDLQFLSGRRTVFQIAAPGPLSEAIDHAYSRGRIVEFLLQNLAAEVAQHEVEIVRDQDLGAPADTYSDTQPVASLVKRFLRQAASVGAEEVRISGTAQGGQVDFRLGGDLQRFMFLPHPALVRVVRRVKELARLDPTQRRRAQDGQFTASVSGRRYVMRVRTIPGSAVESVEIRLTDPSVRPRFTELDLPAEELDAIRALLDGPPGLILVAGHRNRARETLLTAFSRALSDRGPVVVVDSALAAARNDIRQIQADPDAGFEFGEAIARALESHPTSVVVGRVDTQEAAQLAAEAAADTWMVVGVTADDAIGAVSTLRGLGVPAPVLSAGLRGVVSHRSLRRLCERCRSPVVDAEALSVRERMLSDAFGVLPAARPTGCAQCQETGYAGDLLVTHTLVADAALNEAVARGVAVTELRELVRGRSSLEEAAFRQVRAGRTSLHEVERNLPPNLISTTPDRDRPLILVVDDAPEVRLLARSILESRGFDVIDACDGEDALTQLARHDDTSLVLLDLNMPRMGGGEVLSRIRESHRTGQMPVIVLTAEQDPNLEIELMAAGADDYLRKPVEPSRLVVRVQAVLRRAGSYAPQPMPGEPPEAQLAAV